jgi:hypothetical protein
MVGNGCWQGLKSGGQLAVEIFAAIHRLTIDSGLSDGTRVNKEQTINRTLIPRNARVLVYGFSPEQTCGQKFGLKQTQDEKTTATSKPLTGDRDAPAQGHIHESAAAIRGRSVTCRQMKKQTPILILFLLGLQVQAQEFGEQRRSFVAANIGINGVVGGIGALKNKKKRKHL